METEISPRPEVGKKPKTFWWWVQLVAVVLASLFFWFLIWLDRFYL